LAGRLVFPLLAGLAATMVVFGVVAARGGGWAVLWTWYTALAVLGLVAWAAFGAAVAIVVRPVVAVPVAAAVPFAALELPASWDTPWPRHLFGNLVSCCSTNQVLDMRAVTASLAVLGGVAVFSVCVLGVRLAQQDKQVRIAAVVGVVAVALAVAAAKPATSLGYSPTRDRAAAEAVCAEAVCLFPEDAQWREVNTRGLATASEAWMTSGLTDRDWVVAPNSPGALPPVLDSTPDAVVMAFARAMVAEAAGCAADGFDDDAVEEAEALAGLVAGAAGPGGSRPSGAGDRAPADRLADLAGACR
jgi:hypothetical protein